MGEPTGAPAPATLDRVSERAMYFSDGSSHQLPPGVKVTANHGRDRTVYEIEAKQAGFIATGRPKPDCLSFLNWVLGKESH
jgi:hypothetical protein